MKKTIITFAALFIYSISFSQNIGFGVGETVDSYIGFNAGDLRLEYNFILPYNKTDKAKAHAFTVGYGIVLTNKDAESYENIKQIVVTPLIGVSMYQYKTFTESKNETVSLLIT